MTYPVGETHDPARSETVTAPVLLNFDERSPLPPTQYTRGSVLPDGWIDTEGVPRNLMVLRCYPCTPNIERNVLEYYANRRYKPALEDNRPVNYYRHFLLRWE